LKKTRLLCIIRRKLCPVWTFWLRTEKRKNIWTGRNLVQ